MATPTSKPPIVLPEEVRRLAHMLLNMTYIQGMEATLDGYEGEEYYLEREFLARELLLRRCNADFLAHLMVAESLEEAKPVNPIERTVIHLLKGLSTEDLNDVLRRAHISASKATRDPGDA